MKQSELKPCAVCNKGVMHTGLLLFWQVSITRFGVDMQAVQRRHGLELMLGSPVLAGVMGVDEDLARAVGETLYLLICEECAMKPQIIAGLAERDSSDEPEALEEHVKQ